MELPDSVSGLLLSDQATQGAFFRSSQVIGCHPPNPDLGGVVFLPPGGFLPLSGVGNTVIALPGVEKGSFPAAPSPPWDCYINGLINLPAISLLLAFDGLICVPRREG